MKEPRNGKLPLVLIAVAVACFLCYCLGYAKFGTHTQSYSVTTQYIASEEELMQGGDTASTQSDTSTAAEETSSDEDTEDTLELIDLNHADSETLQQLPGIGPERAEAIIQYREEHGIFVSTDEVMNVPGIGTEIYEQIKDLVTVDYR